MSSSTAADENFIGGGGGEKLAANTYIYKCAYLQSVKTFAFIVLFVFFKIVDIIDFFFAICLGFTMGRDLWHIYHF